jgi:AcrR family transcriptional regulator
MSEPRTEGRVVRRRSPDDARERVLEAARSCFRRNGVLATRMDEIADEAQLRRPNLYRYFPSREALIGAAIVREIEITNTRRRERIRLRGPVGTVLVESLVLGNEIARGDEMTQFLLVQDMRELTSTIATSQSLIMSAESEYWYPVLAYGRRRDEINPSMTNERIVRWFLTSQVLLSTRSELFSGLADDLRGYFGDFVVPPVLA